MRRSALLALTLGSCLLLPAVARAGSYVVYSCQQAAGGGVGGVGGWSPTSTDTEIIGTFDGGCAAGQPGLEVFSKYTDGFDVNVGDANYWQFLAPAGTQIGNVSLWMQGTAASGWFLPITDAATGGANATLVTTTWGNIIAEGTSPACQDAGGTAQENYPGCNSGGSDQLQPSSVPAFDNVSLSGQVLDIGVQCAESGQGDSGPYPDCAPTDTTAASVNNPEAGAAQDLYGSQIQIIDNQSPNITSLTVPSQPWVSGTQTLSNTDQFTSDPVGITSETLTLQSASGNDYNYTWNNPNCSDDNAESLIVSNVTYYVPCSDPGAQSFSVNTASLANGCYSTSVSITDPAGNTSSRTGSQMCVSNSAPAAIQNVSTSVSTWTNNTTQSISWTDPTNDPASIANVLYTVNGGAVKTANAGTSLSISSLPEGADSVCVWLEDNAGNANQANENCQTLKIDDKNPTFGSLSYTARSGRITIPASAVSGLNPNSLSFSASDTAGDTAVVDGYIQGGNIVAQFPLADSNRKTWTLKVNVATVASTSVTESFIFYPSNAYTGPKPLTVTHFTKVVKVKGRTQRVAYFRFTPRKAAGSDSSLHVTVNGTLVQNVKSGKAASIKAETGSYTVEVELYYKGGEIVESTAKYKGSKAPKLKWKIA
jgi:hypothetical protein